jgi:uncharacterized protein (DUF2252 family)
MSAAQNVLKFDLSRTIQRLDRMKFLRQLIRDHADVRAEKLRELEQINDRCHAAERELRALADEQKRHD